jgi:hypothetical protein
VLTVLRNRLGLSAGVAASLMSSFGALAQPLDPAACDLVKIEHDALSSSGVTALLQRGPEWAKANAPKSDLVRVARWIELEEQLTFRCGRGKITDGAQRAAAMAEQLEAPPPPAEGEKPSPTPGANPGAAKDKSHSSPSKPLPTTETKAKPAAAPAAKPPTQAP